MSAFERALNHAKNQKIDECELLFSKRKITTIRITDSEISELKQNFDENYGIRLIHQKKIAAAQTSNESNLEKVIDDAINASANLKPREFWKSLPASLAKKPNISGTFDQNLSEISGSDASDLAQQMINSTLNEKINKISGSLNIVSESYSIENSNGFANILDNDGYLLGSSCCLFC